tara:strand:+ start:21144 stop:23387 length:2244 start_codon:yes stop_codon:yes gene_type:complete
LSKFSSLFLDEANDSSENNEALEIRQEKYRILIVDDEENIRKALKRVFRQENYEIFTAETAEKALIILGETPCQLMITDYKMPGMTGADLLREVKALYPETIRILLTGQADSDAVMAAIKDGAVYKFILKPWNDDDLRITVALGLEQYDLKKENDLLKKTNKKNSEELNMLAKLAVSHRSQLAIMLNKKGLLNDQQVQKLYQQQQVKKQSTLSIITDHAWLTEEKIHSILTKDFLFEKIDLRQFQINEAIYSLIPSSFCRKQLVLPLRKEGRRLIIAMADPMDQGLIEELKFTVGLELQAVIASSKDILQKIADIHGEDNPSFKDLETSFGTNEPLDQIEIVIDEEDDIGIEELLRGTDEPPAIRLVNAIMMEAIRLKASDIHIQPKTNSIVTRFRIDGVLQDKLHIPVSLLMPLVSRIKVMAELDITERRRPQDGRITVKTPLRIVDLRISTLPTVNGEKVVMRILDRSGNIQKLSELGFEPQLEQRIDNVIRKPQGIILATGPTGSGKTTTLYSMMQHIASSEKNFVTIEDPVEYFFEQAGQVMIKEKIGLDFTSVLRAILRQDPDVILIGEIRDLETAEVAFHASLTGHQVFSTLHTNSAMDTLARLFDLGMKPYVVASAIEAIIAQRLVRKICKYCKEIHQPEADFLEKLGPLFSDESYIFYHGTGCHQCNNSGMSGRAAIYEVLIPSEILRHGISTDTSILKLKQIALKEGLQALIHDAKRKVLNGEVPLSEVFRVLGPQNI